MKTNANRREVLDEILTECLGVRRDQLTDAARFQEDLMADSLTMTEIVIAVEERLGVEVPEEQAERIRSVGHLREWLEVG